MKQLLLTILTFAVVAAAAFAQSRGPQAPTGLTAAQPFRIDRGVSFDASAGNGRPAGVANAARRRILADIDEAEAAIADNYVGTRGVDTSSLTRSALTSMLHSLDPHSNFFDHDDWQAMLDEQKSGYAGVGMTFAAFTRGSETDVLVLSTVPGTAASRAGLRFGDRIVSVDGMRTEGRTTEEIRTLIRGKLGTNVSIGIERADTLRLETITLSRGVVPQPSVPDFYMIRPGVGFIDLTGGFNYTTYDEVTAALRKLHQAGMTSLIIDLRGNGGGIVDQAVKVVEKFLPAGSLIVSQRGRTIDDTREWRSTNQSPENVPLVLLVDENTASASEIVAGALQDSDRALIVGHRTFGKGLVQNVIELPGETGLTLTAARYFTPTGRSIQRDYSEMGRYEYFSQRGQAADIGKPYIETRTVTNRKMLSGDGIAPDIEAAAPTLTGLQARLQNRLVFFARDLLNRRIAGSETFARGAKDKKVTDAILDRFTEYVSNGQFGITSSLILRERRFVEQQLQSQIDNALAGPLVARRPITAAEPAVVVACDAMPKAMALWNKAMHASHSVFN